VIVADVDDHAVVCAVLGVEVEVELLQRVERHVVHVHVAEAAVADAIDVVAVRVDPGAIGEAAAGGRLDGCRMTSCLLVPSADDATVTTVRLPARYSAICANNFFDATMNGVDWKGSATGSRRTSTFLANVNGDSVEWSPTASSRMMLRGFGEK